MSKSTIAAIIKDHGYLTSSTDIANRYKVSVTTVQRLFRSITASSPMLSAVISIDEFKGNAGAKFQVVINDLTTHTCLNSKNYQAGSLVAPGYQLCEVGDSNQLLVIFFVSE